MVLETVCTEPTKLILRSVNQTQIPRQVTTGNTCNSTSAADMETKATVVNLTKVSSTRQHLCFPTVLTPNGLLPAPGTHNAGVEPPLTHVQQVCLKKRALTRSMETMSHNVLKSRNVAWKKHLAFARRVLPFQVSQTFEFGDLDELAIYPDGKERKKERKQSEQITSYFGCGTQEEAEAVMMNLPKKRGTGGIKSASQRLTLPEGHMCNLTKDIVTLVLGQFLTGAEYLLLATCNRTMIEKALWCKNSINTSHFNGAPSHRHMEVRDITDYILLRRSMSTLCKTMASGCTHVIQSLDFTNWKYIPTGRMRRRIRDDFDGMMWSHVRSFVCNALDFWLGIKATTHPNRLPNLQCLSVNNLYCAGFDLVASGLDMSTLRAFRSGEPTATVLRNISGVSSNLRHLDLLPITLASEGYSSFDWDDKFFDRLRRVLCKLMNLETARIPMDGRRATMPMLYDLLPGMVNLCKAPPFAKTLRKLSVTISANESFLGTAAQSEIHEFLDPGTLPALRELEIAFAQEYMTKSFLKWEKENGERYPQLTQIVDLHFILIGWDNTGNLRCGATLGQSPASLIRNVFPNLKCMRITGEEDWTSKCTIVPTHAQMAFSNENDRWPAELHYYAAHPLSTTASSIDQRVVPELTRHWLNEVKTATPRKFPHGDRDEFTDKCVKEVFARHVLSGGSICAPKPQGQMLHVHKRAYHLTQPTEQEGQQRALTFSPRIDVSYCTQADAKHRDAFFKQHYDQLQHTVYALDNCGCEYHEALRFLWMITLLCKSEYVQSLMQLVFEKSVLIEFGKCQNTPLTAGKCSWISSSGHLPSTVNQEFNKQWTAICGGLQQTAEALTIMLLNYTALDLSRISDTACAPFRTLPDNKQTTQSYDTVLRMVLLTSSLTRALLQSMPLTSMDGLCNQIEALQMDMLNSCDRLRVISHETPDTLFDMDSVQDATFNGEMDTEPAPRLEQKPFEQKMYGDDAPLFVRQEIYNADFCKHKQEHFMQAFMIIADIVQHEDYIRAHVTEDAFERWFVHPVWLRCDMSRAVQFDENQQWCTIHSPNLKNPKCATEDCECEACDPSEANSDGESEAESDE